MRKRVWWLVFAVAVGCGGDSENGGAKTADGDGESGKPAQKTPEPKKPDPAVRAELETKKAALAAKLKTLEADYAALRKKHKEEAAALPSASEKRKLQMAFVEAKRAAKDAAYKADRMERRLAELRGIAESSATGQLKTLREQMAELEKTRARINDAFKDELAAARRGEVDVSPVLAELTTLRELKHAWFKSSSDARRGPVNAAAKKIINDSFKSYLRENALRKKVVTDVLKQDGVPPGATADSYDYTNLDFYLLLEFREDALARQNIVREKKVLSENRGKLDQLDAQIDAIRAKISEAMIAGGDDLVEYDDLSKRIAGQKDSADYLAERFEVLSDQMTAITSMSEVHNRAETAAVKKINAAKKELRDITRKLKSSP